MLILFILFILFDFGLRGMLRRTSPPPATRSFQPEECEVLLSQVVLAEEVRAAGQGAQEGLAAAPAPDLLVISREEGLPNAPAAEVPGPRVTGILRPRLACV